MIKQVILTTVAVAFIVSIAFGQMKYSRPRSASPTPTPTPLPLIPSQKTTTAPRVSQAQIQSKSMPTPIPAQARSTPLPRAASLQSPAPLQRTMSTATQPRPAATPAPTFAKPTPTPVPPPDVKVYLDHQIASAKDQKFHMTLNWKDVPMAPFHVWRQKEISPNMTSTCVDMRGDDGRIYDVDFLTTGAQVSGIRLHKINGEPLR
jgi:hypothetical protein